MQNILGFLSTLAGIYSLLIFIRIILSWFGGMTGGKPVEIIGKLTDPYLDWWRRSLNLKIGFLDFSAVAAIVFLSFLQNILFMLSVSERLTIGFLLAQVLQSAWAIVSFIIGFLMIIIALRAIAYLTQRNIYSPFWSVVESISQPVMYRLNRIMFGNRITGFMKGIICSFILLAVISIAGKFLIGILCAYLSGLPL